LDVIDAARIARQVSTIRYCVLSGTELDLNRFFGPAIFSIQNTKRKFT